MLLEHAFDAVLNGDLSALLPSALSGLIDWAKDAFNEKLNEFNPAKEFMKDLKDWAKNQFEDWMPDASELERIEKDINDLLKDVKDWQNQVVSDIGDTVHNALGSGQIPAQADGGLGQTHDIYTPDGEVPMDMGPLPGIETDAAGTSRAADSGNGDSGGYAGSGSSGSSPGGTTPLGGSGSGSGSSGLSPGSGGTQPPTAGDLGIDPNAYIEYQPTLNQVVITYPDGSMETRPWPAQ